METLDVNSYIPASERGTFLHFLVLHTILQDARLTIKTQSHAAF